MMGTTFKLSFDGTSVGKGLAKLGSTFKTLGTTIGRGAFERVGQRGTDLLMTLITALPDAINKTGAFAGEIFDLSRATGTSVEELTKLYEVMRIGGAEEIEVGRMMTMFSKNLQAAKVSGEGAAESLVKLGLSAADFDGKTFKEELELVFKTIGKSNIAFEEMSQIVTDIFGARGTYKMLAMMKNYEADSARAGKTTKEWGAYLGKNAGMIDEMGDAMGRFKQLTMQVGALAFDVLGRAFGQSGIDRLFDSINIEGLRGKIQDAFSFIGRNLEALLQGDWKQMIMDAIKGGVSNLGEMITSGLSALWKKILSIATEAGTNAGNAFKQSLGIGNSGKSGSLGIGDIIGGIKGMFPGGTTNASETIKPQLEEQTRVLKDIYRQGNVAVWA